jgi:hypothetical protein
MISKQLVFFDDGNLFCTVGHHDYSIRFYETKDGSLIYRLLQHQSIVTCVNISMMGTLLAFGSEDGTLSIWKVASLQSNVFVDAINTIFKKNSGGSSFSYDSSKRQRPVVNDDYTADQVLFGHHSKINCVAVSEELDICLSGSITNECLIHNLSDGKIVKKIQIPGKNAPPGIILLDISSLGHIVIYSLGIPNCPMLYSYHLNGTLLAKKELTKITQNSSPPLLEHLSICSRYSKIVLSHQKEAYTLSAHSLQEKQILFSCYRGKESGGDDNDDDDDDSTENKKEEDQNLIMAQALSPDESHVVFGFNQGRILSFPLFQS